MSGKAKGKPSRSVARLNAVQAMYQISLTGDPASAVVIEFLEHRLGQDTDGILMKNADSTLFSTLVHGTAKDRSQIDEMVAGYLDKSWSLDRIQPLLLAILQTATYELMYGKDTPTAVILNEYLDVTRAFYDDKEVGFVNGVLDKLAHHIRPQS